MIQVKYSIGSPLKHKHINLMDKDIEIDPLETLVRPHDWIEGYKEGVLEMAVQRNQLATELRDFADRLSRLDQDNRTNKDIRVFGIMNGTTLMRERFNDKADAWAKIEEMCGDKISPMQSKFRIIRL